MIPGESWRIASAARFSGTRPAGSSSAKQIVLSGLRSRANAFSLDRISDSTWPPRESVWAWAKLPPHPQKQSKIKQSDQGIRAIALWEDCFEMGRTSPTPRNSIGPDTLRELGFDDSVNPGSMGTDRVRKLVSSQLRHRANNLDIRLIADVNGRIYAACLISLPAGNFRPAVSRFQHTVDAKPRQRIRIQGILLVLFRFPFKIVSVHRLSDSMPARGSRLTLLNRLSRVLRGSSHACVPIRQSRMANPTVGRLEPRLVLNATAELTALGELLITGTDAAETVSLSIDSNGDLQLRDAASEVIEIANHPGNPNDPLSPDAITSGRIRFNLLDGDDQIQVQIPQTLSVEVVAGGGMDTTELTGAELDPAAGSPSPTPDRSIQIESDEIRVGQFDQQMLFDLGAASLDLDGRLIVTGDVSIATSSAIDLSQTIVTADTAGSTIRFDMADAPIFFGTFDASGGQLIQNVVVDAASDVRFGSSLDQPPSGPPTPFGIAGDLSLRRIAGDVSVDSTIEADSISISAKGSVDVQRSMATRGGDVDLTSESTLVIADRISTASTDRFGSIRLTGEMNQFSNATLVTSGGAVTVAGHGELDGLTLIDSGNSATAELGGQILFLDSIESAAGESASLILDSRGSRVGGLVRLVGDIGGTDLNPSANDLGSLTIVTGSDTGQIETRSIGVTGGDVRLTAESIRMLGSSYRTRQSGDVVIDALLRLPIGSSRIESAGDATFAGEVIGQSASERFSVTASGDVRFDESIGSVDSINVAAGSTLTFFGNVSIRGNVDAIADTIRVIGNVNTTAEGSSGNVSFGSTSLLDIDGDVFVGTGAIAIDGGGGRIDTTAGRLESDSVSDAITLSNANRVQLGDTFAEQGRLTLGLQKASAAKSIKPREHVWWSTVSVLPAPTQSIYRTRPMTSTRSSKSMLAIAFRSSDSLGEIRLVDVRSASGGVFVIAAQDIHSERVQSGGTGPIELRAGRDVVASGLLTTSNGQILIHAGRTITVTDQSIGAGNPAQPSAPELVAGGTLGRIELMATDLDPAV